MLLLIQQGPGLPMINEVRRFERVLDLERAFTVVYWDQRGCGLSLRGPNVPGGITVEQMIRDTRRAPSILLRERFAQKSFVAGFSLGAMVGARAAAVRPDLVEGVGRVEWISTVSPPAPTPTTSRSARPAGVVLVR